MKRTRLSLSVVIGLVFTLLAPAWADYQAAGHAYNRGDFDTALKEWRPLAEQGDADAQFNLGVMYDMGLGVPQDYQEAVRWYRRAAEQGNVGAQNNLGFMYGNAQGVPKDYVLAHMWLNLVAAKGLKDAGELRDLLEKNMTPAQLAQAQRLAKEWKAKGE